MFDRFQIFGEDFPNFTNLREWSTIKLFRNKDRSEPATVAAVRFTIYAAFNAIGGQGGEQNQRNITIRELSDLGIDISGPVVMGETPLGVSALAGFQNEPYELRRDVIPPLALQRQIFPMIESQHGSMDPAQWKAHCDRVMMDPLAMPSSSSKQGEARTRLFAAARVSKNAYLELTRKEFLNQLLWFRRIVLQDGALFIRDGSLNSCVLHEVFSTREFEQFKTHLLKKMTERHVQMPSLDRGTVSENRPAVQHDQTNSGMSSNAPSTQRGPGPRSSGISSKAPSTQRGPSQRNGGISTSTAPSTERGTSQSNSGTVSSSAPSTQRGPERRQTGIRQRLLNEQSHEAHVILNNVPSDSDQDLHEADGGDSLAADKALQQWIDQDSKRQQQAHRSLSDLLQRVQEQKQKSHERELRRVQQNNGLERANMEGHLGRLEQRYVLQFEDIQSVRRQIVQQDKNIQRLDTAHKLKLQQLQVELATQADQIALQEERLQLLEEERDDRKQEQRRQTQRKLDQRNIERQLPGPPSFGGSGEAYVRVETSGWRLV
ncbi:hypothetical protein BG006_002180 [Podila minutissima]|uniref:Uncharacterized protein n=1 Tax=Podila minutissima TaxID=64525 RepID=A0A9P5SRM2_9FUNG|nr:hypothetical protein BG006_002180 [Podila minutissima]